MGDSDINLHRAEEDHVIQTQSTPNPLSLMFYHGKPVMNVGSADFSNVRTAMNSPLAKDLYGIDDFINVTKSDDATWDFLKPEIFAAIMDFYSSGKPLFLDLSTKAAMDTVIHEDDSCRDCIYCAAIMSSKIFMQAIMR